jgi:hypothetical protein
VQTLAHVKTLASAQHHPDHSVVLVINGALAAWLFHLAATSSNAVPQRDDQ